jgi:natural product biosynthesis luciferase-like monooxygenase protein
VKFGYYILNTYVPELDGDSTSVYSRWLEQIDAAESLGFESLWVTEHHFRHFGGMMPSPAIILAAAAQRTKRLRLGAAVSILPMHNPLRIAEEFAMVDQLSNGRLNFGAGRGMHPTEYTVFGYDWSNAQKRLPEALDIVMRAWSGAEFEWRGEHYRFPKLRVFPQPVQKPHPPIYVTANRDPESFNMIGERGHHLMTLPWIATNEEQRAAVEMYWAALRGAGHAIERREVFTMYPVYVGETDEQARPRGDRALASVARFCDGSAKSHSREPRLPTSVRPSGLRCNGARQPRCLRCARNLRAHSEANHRNCRYQVTSA